MIVETLAYDLVTGDFHSFSAQADWQGSLGDFNCRLQSDVLVATPRTNIDLETARASLEPWLASWARITYLIRGFDIHFRFRTSKSRDGSGLNVQVTEVGHSIDAVTSLEMSDYPAPPGHLLSDSPLVEEMMRQVRMARAPDQPLLAPGYLVLSLLEFTYGSRRQAGNDLNIDGAVLSKLGETTAANDPAERRKAKGPVRHLTDAERVWLLEALARITIQVATKEAGNFLRRLDMSILPPV